MAPDVAATRARLAAITPGKWRVVCDDRWNGHLNMYGPRFSVVKDISTTLDLGAVDLLALCSDPRYKHAEEDATFIAAAPDDIRALLDAYEDVCAEMLRLLGVIRRCANTADFGLKVLSDGKRIEALRDILDAALQELNREDAGG